MAEGFLDKTGLTYFWGKIKAYLMRRNLAPEQTKTYTGVIATANSDPAAYFYYGSIKPVNYNLPWVIKLKIHSTIAGLSNYQYSHHELRLEGAYNTYYCWDALNTNQASYRSFYYHLLRCCSATGINNGYGHLLGVRLQSSYNPATAANSRTFKIEILETENCTFEFFDSMILYANAPGTGTTNYANFYQIDAVTAGHKMYGDANDVNYYNRVYYGIRTTATYMPRFSVCLSKHNKSLVPTVTVDNNVTTSKDYTTESFDPFGEIFYWASTTTYAAGANVGDGALYKQYLGDFRYAFNIGGYTVASTLTARKPLYLVAKMQSDGSAILHSAPLSQTLPTTADGLIYIYLGHVYPDTYPYRVYLSADHPVYEYHDGRIRPYQEKRGNAQVFSGICSTAAATVDKAVTCEDFTSDDLVLGAIVSVKFNETNSGAVGSLTLNVNGTGAKPIRYVYNGAYSNVPGANYIRAGQLYQFTYDGTYWVIQMMYNTNTNPIYLLHQNYVLAKTAITANSLIVGDASGYSRVASGLTFDITYPILWCTAAVAANAQNYANMFLCHYDLNIATGAKTGFTSTKNKVIYLVVTISGNTATVDSTIITDTLPTTDDGKVYIVLGRLGNNSTGANYFLFYPNHPMFWYKSNGIKPYTGFEEAAIGQIYENTKNMVISDTSAIDTTTAGASITVPKGTYVIIGYWGFNTRSSSGTTNSAVLIRNGSGTAISQERVFAAANNWNSLQTSTIVNVTANSETFTVHGSTSRAYTTATPTWIKAVRIA